jgi:hypothetical protein
MKKHAWVVTLGSLAALLNGCGGGGGGGGAPPSTAPVVTVIRAQTFTTAEDVPYSGVLTTTPALGASVTVRRISDPSLGTLSSFSPTGAFTYVPNTNAFGVDTFSVEAVDSAGHRAQATITLNINPVNDAPIARGEHFAFLYRTSFSLNVLANDEDVEGQPLAVELYVPSAGETPNPAVGSAAVVGQTIEVNGVPEPFAGLISVSYRVRDSSGEASSVVTAYVFANLEPFNIWYSLDRDTKNVYVSDLLTSRAVTALSRLSVPATSCSQVTRCTH